MMDRTYPSTVVFAEGKYLENWILLQARKIFFVIECAVHFVIAVAILCPEVIELSGKVWCLGPLGSLQWKVISLIFLGWPLVAPQPWLLCFSHIGNWLVWKADNENIPVLRAQISIKFLLSNWWVVCGKCDCLSKKPIATGQEHCLLLVWWITCFSKLIFVFCWPSHQRKIQKTRMITWIPIQWKGHFCCFCATLFLTFNAVIFCQVQRLFHFVLSLWFACHLIGPWWQVMRNENSTSGSCNNI